MADGAALERGLVHLAQAQRRINSQKAQLARIKAHKVPDCPLQELQAASNKIYERPAAASEGVVDKQNTAQWQRHDWLDGQDARTGSAALRTSAMKAEADKQLGLNWHQQHRMHELYCGLADVASTPFHGTYAENIAYRRLTGRGAISAVVIAAAQAAGLHDSIVRLPQQYWTIIGSGQSAAAGVAQPPANAGGSQDESGSDVEPVHIHVPSTAERKALALARKNYITLRAAQRCQRVHPQWRSKHAQRPLGAVPNFTEVHRALAENNARTRKRAVARGMTVPIEYRFQQTSKATAAHRLRNAWQRHARQSGLNAAAGGDVHPCIYQDLVETSNTAANRARARYIKRKCDRGLFAAGCSHVNSPLFGLEGRHTRAQGNLVQTCTKAMVAAQRTGHKTEFNVAGRAERSERRRHQREGVNAVWRWLAVAEPDAGGTMDLHEPGNMPQEPKNGVTDGQMGGMHADGASGDEAKGLDGPVAQEPPLDTSKTVASQAQRMSSVPDAEMRYREGATPRSTSAEQLCSADYETVALKAAAPLARAATHCMATSSTAQAEHVSCDDLAEQCLRRL
eukprot:jgi/Ulvmu1/12210/UM085_0074.1